jgi:NAD(P)-dependent dehydrogenase (short-subunit alcohol dehydrogenase family)
MKSALITGSGAGIGRATALAFAAAGYAVVVFDVDAGAADETAELVRAAGGEAESQAGDVRRSEDLARAVEAAVSRYGSLDAAVNNAGVTIGHKSRAAEIEESDWRRVLDVNLTGVWLAMRHEIPTMLAGDGGAIVNLSSVAGLVGSTAADAAYAASKHGIIGLTKTAALDYATAGVRVNAICPGPVNTAMVENARHMESFFKKASPMERIAEPGEIAATAVWLCSDAASFITGAALPVDGGYVAR